MKYLLFFIFSFAGQTAHAQYTVDPKVKHTFDSIFALQPRDIQEKRYIEGFNDGFTLLLHFTEDTLNLNDYKPQAKDNAVQLVLLDTNGMVLMEGPADEPNYLQWLSCQAAFLKDTLHISAYYGLFSGYGFTLKITGDNISGGYFEHVQDNPVYRVKQKGPKSSEVKVLATAENVVLSKVPDAPGDIFYGKATLYTAPFYQDDEAFTHGFVHKQCRLTFIFTCKLTEYRPAKN